MFPRVTITPSADPARGRTRFGLAAVAFLGLPGAALANPAANVVLPWGDVVIAAAQVASALLVPLAIAAASAAIARIAGPLRVLVTTTLVERLVRNVADYAVNAVSGAVRGRILTVPIGSAVIARAVQRALDQAPAWLVTAAGGRDGLAEKVFRSLPLDEAATAANTLAPALEAVRTGRTRLAWPRP